MDTESDYTIILTDDSTCPKCGKLVKLLCDKAMRKEKPAFYICFDCEFVGEVAKGEVMG